MSDGTFYDWGKFSFYTYALLNFLFPYLSIYFLFLVDSVVFCCSPLFCLFCLFCFVVLVLSGSVLSSVCFVLFCLFCFCSFRFCLCSVPLFSGLFRFVSCFDMFCFCFLFLFQSPLFTLPQSNFLICCLTHELHCQPLAFIITNLECYSLLIVFFIDCFQCC